MRKLYIRRLLDSRYIRSVLKINALGMKPHAANPTDCKQIRTVYQPQWRKWKHEKHIIWKQSLVFQ